MIYEQGLSEPFLSKGLTMAEQEADPSMRIIPIIPLSVAKMLLELYKARYTKVLECMVMVNEATRLVYLAA